MYIKFNYNIVLIQISQRLVKKIMSFVVANVNQKRCNFCFNWIVGTSLSKDTLNCCDACLWKYTQKSAEVRTVGGQTYQMLLLKYIQHQAIVRQHFAANTQDQSDQQIDEHSEKQLGIQTIMEQDGLIHQQESVHDSSVSPSKESDIQKDHLAMSINKIKNINFKSLFLDSDGKQSENGEVHRSCFLQISNREKPLAKSDFKYSIINIVLIQISQRLVKKIMSFVVANVNQKRCNFCFNWIVGTSLSKDTLNCCDACLWKYTQKSAEVRTVGGQTYQMLLLKYIQHQAIVRQHFAANTQDQSDQQIDEHSEKQLGIQTIMEQDGLIHQQESVHDSSVSPSKESDIQKDHLAMSINKIKNINFKSLFLDSDGKQSENGEVHRSCFLQISNREKPLAKSMNNNQFKDSEDSGSKLHLSRNSGKYRFYYDRKSTKHFKFNPDTGERQFGDELDWNTQRELFSNLKANLRDNKTSRSVYSSQNQKFSEEELKHKIASYIQTHYHTPSLHKPLVNYIKEAYEKTNIHHKTLELTSFKITSMDILCYLSLFNFEKMQTIKLVNVGLTDHQLPILIEFVWNKQIQILMLSGNKLTEMSLEHLKNKSFPYLKQIYLGKNSINKCKAKDTIAQLHSKFKLYL